MPGSEGHMDYHQQTPSAGPVSMSFAWPSEFSSAHPVRTGADMMRKDSWSEGCDPMSTLLPTAPMWDQSAVSHAEYQSPELSEYSTSTQASCMSSPYAHSDNFLRTAGSPLVKLENQSDYMPGQLHYIPESAPFSQSLLVRPGDLVTHSPSMQHQAATSPILASNHMDVDCKPDLSSLRPDNRIAFSSEDYQSANSDGRPKRGFTKPETANCHCDQCGKLFQRSYNLKAHLETHDPNRSHPHVCEYIDCDKQFVRRTDLVRHEQSVSQALPPYTVSPSLTRSSGAPQDAQFPMSVMRQLFRAQGYAQKVGPRFDWQDGVTQSLTCPTGTLTMAVPNDQRSRNASAK